MGAFDQDLLIVGALVLLMFVIPALYAALIDRRMPRLSLLFLILAVAMIYYAVKDDPDGVQLRDIPMAVVQVISRYFY